MYGEKASQDGSGRNADSLLPGMEAMERQAQGRTLSGVSSLKLQRLPLSARVR